MEALASLRKKTVNWKFLIRNNFSNHSFILRKKSKKIEFQFFDKFIKIIRKKFLMNLLKFVIGEVALGREMSQSTARSPKIHTQFGLFREPRRYLKSPFEEELKSILRDLHWQSDKWSLRRQRFSFSTLCQYHSLLQCLQWAKQHLDSLAS
jgi:hypothetical protein